DHDLLHARQIAAEARSAPEIGEPLARLLRPAGGEPIRQHHRIDRARGCPGNAVDRKPAVGQQLIEHAPGEGAVSAAALQREVDALGRGRRLAPERAAENIHCAIQPPSIEWATPEMVAAASPHRNTVSAPIDSGVVNWCIGCFSESSAIFACSTVWPFALARASICFCTNGVSTQPGQIALQVMPSFAASMATTLVRPISPC